ncbi:histone-like nucleoid-structuring protein Lsr2 [Nocardioides abyssi]|uniref:Lsr2 family protein n=1 Tax=Nocardioides abyssi TaxID=3058370 RepID=A0ABT8ESI1_9ACTN|nr:Lsr2 family protein [Nocardioides abyssi]MDN4161090.1 Lsr2 family protein [Nocardioides abyssi]
MAQRVVMQLEDDLDGTPIEDGEGETVAFALDGTSYEIDLTSENAAALRAAVENYVAAARKVAGSRGGAGRGRRSGSAGSKSGGSTAREVREWARSNGYEVPDRGRVPKDVQEAFDAAR